MAKISERFLSTNMLREKRRDSFDPQRANLFGEDSFFSFFYDCLLRLFQKRSFVLSSEHENQNVATIGTLLDQFMLKFK